MWKDVEKKIKVTEYSRVVMKLSELLDADFFNSYIKSGILCFAVYHIYNVIPSSSDLLIGNVLMLSEGRPGVEDLYFFKDGTLALRSPTRIRSYP